MSEEVEFEDEVEDDVEDESTSHFSDAVMFSSDWTVETILSQLEKDNIQLNPNFQRREAWPNSRKSKFIETVIVGLPAPQLVFAEVKGKRGKYIVLDGKQRLLSLLRFAESKESARRGFALSSLKIRKDLNRKKFFHFENDLAFEAEKDAFMNYTVRTVIIRNWPNNEFLHQVFLRLNTGSVKLSSQELRQAMAPGDFTKFADDYAAESAEIQAIFNRNSPDPRMRDVELLVRHVAFADRLEFYRGRMKDFLDETCAELNDDWETEEARIRQMATDFESGIATLRSIFGSAVARKPNSRSFNRAIFDALAFYAAKPEIRYRMGQKKTEVASSYRALFDNTDFSDAVESDTAGIPNTEARLQIWGQALRDTLQIDIDLPAIPRREG